LCGIVPRSKAPCFDFKIGQCRGACTGVENASDYNRRVECAIDTFKPDDSDFILTGAGRKYSEKSAVLVRSGKYAGYGFFEPEWAGDNIESILGCIKPSADDPDARNIIKNAMRRKHQSIIKLN